MTAIIARAPWTVVGNFLGTFLVAPLLASSALAGTIRHDVLDAGHIALAGEDRFQSIGKLTWREPGIDGLASGALIHPQWVLTAAHVIDGFDLEGGGISNLRFDVGGASYRAADWYPHESWADSGGETNLFAGWDIGLVRLDSPVTEIVPAELYTGSDELGQSATLVGFGATGNGQSGALAGSAGTKRAGTNVVDLVGRSASPGSFIDGFSHDRLIAVDFDNPDDSNESTLGSAVPLPQEYLTAPGDSGGGLFLDVGDQARLAGVVSLGSTLDADANSDYGDRAAFTRVSQFVDWIDARIGASLDLVSGDYNGNGVVDAADYNVWRDSFQSTRDLAADGNGNGIVDLVDYTVWRDRFGTGAAGSSTFRAIPEPPGWWLAVAVVLYYNFVFGRWPLRGPLSESRGLHIARHLRYRSAVG